MKFFSFFILTILSNPGKSIESFIGSAISQIAQKVFADQNGFEFIIYGETTQKIEKIIKEVKKSTGIPQLQRIMPSGSLKVNTLNRSAILFFASWETYRIFHYRSYLMNQYQTNFYFLVYIEDQTRDRYFMTRKMGSSRSQPRFFYDYFLKILGNFILLSTFETFQRKKCESLREVNINQFSKLTHKWTSQKFFLKKFENFNGCRMDIGAIYPQNLVLTVDFNKSGKPINVKGYGTVFNDVISKYLNYTYFYNPARKLNAYIYKLYNKSLKVDFRIEADSFRSIMVDTKSLTYVTDHYTTVDEIILISRFKPYSIFDKIFLPFEDDVWFWLLGTMSILIFASLVISLSAPETMRNFIFGPKVKTPLLNIL